MVRRRPLFAVVVLVACGSGESAPAPPDARAMGGAGAGGESGGGRGGQRADAAAGASGVPDGSPSSGGTAGGGTSAADASADPAISDLTVTGNPRNVLSYYVSWTTTRPTPSELRVTCNDTDDRVLLGTISRTSHAAFVMGLLSGSVCTFTAVADLNADGGRLTATDTVTVPPLPAFLPTLTLSHGQAADAGSPDGGSTDAGTPGVTGWTAFNVGKQLVATVPMRVVIVDELGRYRWYHSVDTTDPGSDNDVVVLDDGVLIGGTRSSIDTFRVDFEGNVLWRKRFSFGDPGMHHDITPFGPPGEYLFLTEGAFACPPGGRSGMVVHYDQPSDVESAFWYGCEGLTHPGSPLGDWDHMNSIAPVPNEDAILVSARDLSQVFKIDTATKALLWTLGTGGDFTFVGDAGFVRQHEPEPQPNGNVLLYDNGSSLGRAYSRVVEYALDAQSGTATLVWEFRPTPDIYTDIWGDADRLADGHTLAVFGQRDLGLPSQIIEIDALGREIWRLTTPISWGIYRAQRLASPLRGYVIP